MGKCRKTRRHRRPLGVDMTKKDYIAIAAAMNNAFKDGDKGLLVLVANHLSAVFEKENPRFDSERFMAACLETK